MSSIRQRLTRRLLLTVGVLILGVGLTVYWSARTALQSEFDAALRAKAHALCSLTELDSGRLEVELREDQFHGFRAGGKDFFAIWFDDASAPAAASPSLGGRLMPRPKHLGPKPHFWDLRLPDGEPGRAIALRFTPGHTDEEHHEARSDDPPRLEKQAIIVVASERHGLNRTLATLALVLGGSGLLLMAAVAVLVPRVLRRELSPLQRLAEQASRIDARSLHERFPSDNLPDELRPIVERLNALLARLEESFARERQFSSDVAHEFRTPIAELRSLAELALKFPEARPPNTDREVLAIALHLEAVLKQLLALARGEQRQLEVHTEPVPLAALVNAVWTGCRPKATQRHLEFENRVHPELVVLSDPALLRSILHNLLDNAATYASPDSAVVVEALDRGQLVDLRVSNRTEGIAPEDLSHFFERFWRKDSSRYGSDHAGLGLAVARVFADSLQAELKVVLERDETVVLTLAGLKKSVATSKTFGDGYVTSRS